jgi:Mg2+ and Co2+ transporter CorA
LVAGLVLVPTLVVGIFGANTELPGEGSWLGFVLMIALMLVLAGLSYLWLGARRTGPSVASDDSVTAPE